MNEQEYTIEESDAEDLYKKITETKLVEVASFSPADLKKQYDMLTEQIEGLTTNRDNVKQKYNSFKQPPYNLDLPDIIEQNVII